MLPVGVQVLVRGSYSSADARTPFPWPPAAKTARQIRSAHTKVWEACLEEGRVPRIVPCRFASCSIWRKVRVAVMAPVELQLPVRGSYSSADARIPPEFWPPAARTAMHWKPCGNTAQVAQEYVWHSSGRYSLSRGVTDECQAFRRWTAASALLNESRLAAECQVAQA